LKKLGANVIGYALDPYTPDDFFNKTNLSDKIVDIRGNILDIENLNKVFKEYNPDIVFHLAAQPLVRLSYDLPVDTFQTNVLGTLNVLEAIRQNSSVQMGIIITTDKVYQNFNTIWGYREIDPLGGHDPYSASKACAEIVVDSYIKSFFKQKEDVQSPKIATVRAGNVIGGGDWQKDRIIPDSIKSLTTGQQIRIRNPKAIRPWQHVIDALGGYLLLGEKMMENTLPAMSDAPFQHAWNFGPMNESAITVEELVTKVVGAWGSGEWFVETSINETKEEAKLLTLDITKSIAKLGWHPVLDIDECIAFTIDWYKYTYQNPDADMHDYSIQQIDEYLRIANRKGLSWTKEE
jgi:CDP-glucose 4,6-dehydratase